MSQGGTFLDTYKANVKSWLADEAFWRDMSQYVRFWSQEAYGRVDAWAVPGTTPEDRLAPTADYLEHFAHLAAGGAYVLGASSPYLALADGPTGNAAWPMTAYEWPVPPVDYTIARAYAVAQVFAFRHEQSARDGDQVFGFAWSPVNLSRVERDLRFHDQVGRHPRGDRRGDPRERRAVGGTGYRCVRHRPVAVHRRPRRRDLQRPRGRDSTTGRSRRPGRPARSSRQAPRSRFRSRRPTPTPASS